MRVAGILQEVLPENTYYAIDMTQIAYTTRTAMGFELPAAVGAKIAQPDSPVMAILGDGGLMYAVAEMAAAAD